MTFFPVQLSYFIYAEWFHKGVTRELSFMKILPLACQTFLKHIYRYKYLHCRYNLVETKVIFLRIKWQNISRMKSFPFENVTCPKNCKCWQLDIFKFINYFVQLQYNRDINTSCSLYFYLKYEICVFYMPLC